MTRLAPSQTANGGFTLSADHCILRDPPWSESSCCRVASRGSGLQKHLDQAKQVADLALLQDDDDDETDVAFKLGSSLVAAIKAPSVTRPNLALPCPAGSICLLTACAPKWSLPTNNVSITARLSAHRNRQASVRKAKARSAPTRRGSAFTRARAVIDRIVYCVQICLR